MPSIQSLKGLLVFLLPLVLSPGWSLVVVKNLSTYPPVDGVGDLTVLPEVVAKDGGSLSSLSS